ncbi:hypothetical protein BPT24_021 [Tenacibaculum phage pT24]|uniref:Uncharacterized protein n=1 Tax=Tenacibaculum phage pT24 TaxID=1880590 RepID=A0A1B4XWE8_9CAUD|nr:hypothetical protein HYP10_gp021 [Tenacibaculum phage pT24]BAV39143.1 hypothetical protein BPT24_021 [Tenacibaculum phage pT24]
MSKYRKKYLEEEGLSKFNPYNKNNYTLFLEKELAKKDKKLAKIKKKVESISEEI